MKDCFAIAVRHLSVLGLFVLLLSGCAKEPLDGPAPAAVVGPKSMPLGSVDQPAGEGLNTGRTISTDEDGDSISDDGDDISDGERNRKKRSN